jgi:hypothetical protein
MLHSDLDRCTHWHSNLDSMCGHGSDLIAVWVRIGMTAILSLCGMHMGLTAILSLCGVLRSHRSQRSQSLVYGVHMHACMHAAMSIADVVFSARHKRGNDTNTVGATTCLPAFNSFYISVVGDPDQSQRLCSSYFHARLSVVCRLVGIAQEKQIAATQATHPYFHNFFPLCDNEIPDCSMEALAMHPIGYVCTKVFLPMALTNEARSFIEPLQAILLVGECSAQHVFFQLVQVAPVAICEALRNLMIPLVAECIEHETFHSCNLLR